MKKAALRGNTVPPDGLQKLTFRTTDPDFIADHRFHGIHTDPHVIARIIAVRILRKPGADRSGKGNFQLGGDIDFAHPQLNGTADIRIRHITRAVQYQRDIRNTADFFTVSDVRCILLSKKGVVLRSPFRKAFFLFHRPFFYDNWLSMTIHDRRFEGIPLVISFVVIYQ